MDYEVAAFAMVFGVPIAELYLGARDRPAEEMNDLSAQDFLGIYETQLRKAEKGAIHLSRKVVAGLRVLITALRQLDPKEKVSRESKEVRTVFKKASTGDLLAQIEFE